jgi:hypothetical protein
MQFSFGFFFVPASPFRVINVMYNIAAAVLARTRLRKNMKECFQQEKIEFSC